jgi:hypothetical protein
MEDGAIGLVWGPRKKNGCRKEQAGAAPWRAPGLFIGVIVS